MKRYIGLFIALVMGMQLQAQDHQKEMRAALRAGNRLYFEHKYEEADVHYRKAYLLDTVNAPVNVLYDLGTNLLTKSMMEVASDSQNQELAKKEVVEAHGYLMKAAQKDMNKFKGTRVFHNLGVSLQFCKEYQKAIEAYKQALRLNPKDEETRYNLALCQKLLKNQPQQDQQQQQQQQDQKQDQKQDQQQDQQDKKEDKKDDKQPPQQQPQQPKNEMSKDNAQQLLEAVKQEEKNVQQRMMQQQSGTRRKKSKDW